MHLFEVREREDLLLRVAEDGLDGGIHALEVPVEVRDPDEIGGECEDAVELALRSRPPCRVHPEQADERSQRETAHEDDPRHYGGCALYRARGTGTSNRCPAP